MSSQYQDSQSASGTIESLAKLEATPQGKADRWRDEIRAAERTLGKWHKAARRVVKRFIDDRDAIESGSKWINLFNANVGILEASLYGQIPTVDVSRRFADMNDDVARVAASILQRSIEQDMDEPSCDFDQVMRQAISDRLVPGMGTAWLRLENTIEPQEPPILGEDGEPLEAIADQEVAIDYVYWEDFLWSPCRVWAERRWVARKVPMTRDALTARFGEDLARTVPLDYHPEKNSWEGLTAPESHSVLKRACVYEIWDREAREVIWLSKGVEQLLDVKPDPLGLEGFEPCPKPMMANVITSECLPKPDYSLIQDQYTEMDETNNRISLLIIACKVVGVYDRSADGIQRMLSEGYDNTLIPVDNWAMFAEKGGVKGQIDWLPLDTVVQALGQLQAHREAIKQQIYELTGISDIVRGASKASETLGAQELKSKYASIRIQKLQDEVTRFAQEILQLKAELLVKHFEPTILAKMSNIENTPDAEFAIPALQLIKGPEDAMEWRVRIRANSLAMIDYTQRKTERSEFMNSVATFLQSASTVGQGSPQLVPLMLEMLRFGVAGFQVSKDIEGTFDKYIKEFEDTLEAQKSAPPQPDPEQQKMQAEMQMEQQRLQMEQQSKQTDAQIKLQEAQAKMQQDQMMFQQEMAQMREKFALEMQMEREKNAIALETAKMNAVMKQAEGQQRLEQQEEQQETERENADRV